MLYVKAVNITNLFTNKFDFEFQEMGYGIYESKLARIKLDTRPTRSCIVLEENNLISIRCDFQYLIDWLKRKNTNRLQFAIIHTFFAKTFSLRLSQSPNRLKRLLFSNIDLKGFKNYVLNNGYFKVYDKQSQCFQEYVECRKVIDNPAPAIGSSKLVFSYKREVFHERILELY